MYEKAIKDINAVLVIPQPMDSHTYSLGRMYSTLHGLLQPGDLLRLYTSSINLFRG